MNPNNLSGVPSKFVCWQLSKSHIDPAIVSLSGNRLTGRHMHVDLEFSKLCYVYLFTYSMEQTPS